MLNPVVDHKPVGFSGRPLIALAFAVGIGSAEYYIAMWLGLREPVASIVPCAVIGLVGWLWYRAEKPK
jgi:hypothetical protein